MLPAVACGLLLLAAASPVAAARHRPGSLDRSFNGGQVRGLGVIVGSLFGDRVEDFAGLSLMPGGRIVLAGDAETGTGLDYALAALHRNGRFDTGFGPAPDHVVVDGISGEDNVNAVASAPGGRIYIAAASISGVERFGVARFTADGAKDAGFGGGTTTTEIGTSAEPRAIAVQRDAKPVVAGSADIGGVRQIALVRYLTNGLPDPGFGGGDGVVTTKVGDSAESLDVEVQRNGRIVVAGKSVRPGNKSDATFLRYRPNGSLDPSFGGDGISRLRNGNQGTAFAIELGAKGKLVAAAAGGKNTFTPIVARLTESGKRDRSFGGGDGIVRSPFGQSGLALITDLAVQRNGKIALAGIGGDLPGIPGGTLVARLRPNGAIDRGFGNRGARLFALGATGTSFPRLLILRNGKLLVGAKLAIFPDTTGFMALRLFGDPVRR